MLRRVLLPDAGVVVAERLRIAGDLRRRMRGLLEGPPLEPGEGLLLSPCKQVHTLGMRLPIDVVFCDRRWRAVGVVRSMPPWRVSRIYWKARHALELAPGGAGAVSVGDRLLLEEVPL